MKIQKTGWKSDICGCVLEHTWDSDIPAEERVAIEAFCLWACPAHEGLKANPLDMRTTVLEENQRKNYALAEVLKTLPLEFKDTALNSDGDEIEVFKPEHEPGWSFDENRNLVIELSAASKVSADAVATAANARFPKVIIQ